MLSRRNFIKMVSASAFASTFPAFNALSYSPLSTDKRFILLILRGGMDGINSIIPYGDREYSQKRKELLMPNPAKKDGGIDLNGFFALHPKLELLHKYYKNDELAIFPAVGLTTRTRSHFDSQNILENGTLNANGRRDGWLNRTVQLFNEKGLAEKNFALAFGQQLPFIMQGAATISSWQPSRRKDSAKWRKYLFDKVKDMYQYDPLLGASLRDAMEISEIASLANVNMQKKSRNETHDTATIRAIANMLSAENGVRIVTAELNGWDTHARQGTNEGQLARNLDKLAKTLDGLASSFTKDIWDKTVIAVVTEFGRTVKVNGTGGTDHGTGSMSLVMGGAVNGGKFYGGWPGLKDKNLYQGRDLMPTTDMFAIFRSILNQHMGLNISDINKNIFPNSSALPPIHNLIG